MMQAVTAVPAMATSIIQAALPRIWTVVHGSVPSLQACSYCSMSSFNESRSCREKAAFDTVCMMDESRGCQLADHTPYSFLMNQGMQAVQALL